MVKVGSNLLTAGTERLDLGIMAALVGQVARLNSAGYQVLLVSSGAVAAGRHILGNRQLRRDTPVKQILAAIGQSRLVDAYDQLFKWHGVTIAQTLLTRADLTDRERYLNARNTLLGLLDLGVVPIVNENDVVAVNELVGLSIGDNDNLSALVASAVDADQLIILSDITGLYTADPRLDPAAQLIARVEQVDAAIEARAGGPGQRGLGGMRTKLQAARLATAGGIAVVIADGHEPDVLPRLAAGEAIGTYFAPTTSRVESRKRWMLGAWSGRGYLSVDAGAATALREHGRSLLPAGIAGVQGAFERGDVVLIVGVDGGRVACGISNYAEHEVERIRGLRSDQIADRLGYDLGAEVVHRSNLVIL